MKELMTIIYDHKAAFSLHDEIGQYQNIKIDIEVIDESLFFVRPFPISQKVKPIMDWQKERLVSLGILSKNSSSHTSLVMLISNKLTKGKRPVVEFRLLNTRILRRNTATPLINDILQIVGNSKCETLSYIDFKDALHSLRLTERSKEFCGILPYFGSAYFRCEVLPMRLSISSSQWMEYIQMLLENIEFKSSYIMIMDDLLVHSMKSVHMERLTNLLKVVIKYGLNISPKKCQLFQTNLVYLGYVFHIKDRKMTIRPIKTRIEAIQKLPLPKSIKEYKSFIGVVNYLSLFCPNLQRLLKPIYELTRKVIPFRWHREHNEAFLKIKSLLIKPPVLHLQICSGRFILYSDTSGSPCGSSLWQRQLGKPNLIGYASKTLPKACLNYSVTELEITGLVSTCTYSDTS